MTRQSAVAYNQRAVQWCAGVQGRNRVFHVLHGMSFHAQRTVSVASRFSKHSEDRSRNHGARVAAGKARQ